MRRLLPLALFVLSFMATAALGDAPEIAPRKGKSERIELFNGKDITSWVGHKDKYWSVKDGEIVGRNTDEVPVSTYLLTPQKFSDFQLVFSARLVESEMHSGIAFWGEVAPTRGDEFTYKGHLVMFPSGWGLYDLYGRAGLKVDTKPALKINRQHDWNDIEIFAQGNRIRVVANGILVVDWRDPEPERIKEGPIGLQLHSNKERQEVRFKGLALTTFPDATRLFNKKVGDKIAPPDAP
jgi:hypothetical protein